LASLLQPAVVYPGLARGSVPNRELTRCPHRATIHRCRCGGVFHGVRGQTALTAAVQVGKVEPCHICLPSTAVHRVFVPYSLICKEISSPRRVSLSKPIFPSIPVGQNSTPKFFGMPYARHVGSFGRRQRSPKRQSRGLP